MMNYSSVPHWSQASPLQHKLTCHVGLKRLAVCGSIVQGTDQVCVLTVTVSCRAESLGGLREYNTVVLNVDFWEVEQGLKKHTTCPNLLKHALTKEAIRTTYVEAG